MIITRTPLRISLGGGGTDLPSYYREAGVGFLVAAAIDRHVYIAVHKNFEDGILLKYSHLEQVSGLEDIEHPLLRECLRFTQVHREIEISSMADIPAGTGLGSSGAFAVGVLKALNAYQHVNVTNEQIARDASFIEMDRLGEPVGKQDQYIAAVGGLTAFEFHADDTVTITPVKVSNEARHVLEENLLLFYTGVRRPASEVLAIEQTPTKSRPPGSLRENLDAVREIGRESYAAISAGTLDRFGELMTAQWKLKFERSPTPVHGQIDELIARGIRAGASGGKLVGAGGGGFLLFYAEEKRGLRRTMHEHGLQEVRFSFDSQGSTTIVAS